MSIQTKGRIYIVLCALLWGLAGVCVKSIPWSSQTLICARSVIAIMVLGIYRKSFKLEFNKKTLYGSIMMSITGILYLAAIKLTTAASAIVLQYTAPIFVFVYAIIFNNRKTSLKEIGIIFLVFLGCVLSFAGDLDPTKTLGNILAILSGISFAGQIVIFSDPEVKQFDGLYLSNIISFVVCLPFIFSDHNLIFTPNVIFWVLVLSIFQYGIANIMYAKGCKLIDKVECSLILTIEPIFNPIPVLLINGEMMSFLSFVGFIFVIVGITLYTLNSNKVKN